MSTSLFSVEVRGNEKDAIVSLEERALFSPHSTRDRGDLLVELRNAALKGPDEQLQANLRRPIARGFRRHHVVGERVDWQRDRERARERRAGHEIAPLHSTRRHREYECSASKSPGPANYGEKWGE